MRNWSWPIDTSIGHPKNPMISLELTVTRRDFCSLKISTTPQEAVFLDVSSSSYLPLSLPSFHLPLLPYIFQTFLLLLPFLSTPSFRPSSLLSPSFPYSNLMDYYCLSLIAFPVCNSYPVLTSHIYPTLPFQSMIYITFPCRRTHKNISIHTCGKD